MVKSGNVLRKAPIGEYLQANRALIDQKTAHVPLYCDVFASCDEFPHLKPKTAKSWIILHKMAITAYQLLENLVYS